MRTIKIKCRYCERCFYKEYNMITHVLFEHELLMPTCSTGIAEKLYHDNMYLILETRKLRKDLTEFKTLLKRKFLKSMFGRKCDLKNEYQSNLFDTELDKLHNNEYTRLKYEPYHSYLNTYTLVENLMKQIEAKGLIWAH